MLVFPSQFGKCESKWEVIAIFTGLMYTYGKDYLIIHKYRYKYSYMGGSSTDVVCFDNIYPAAGGGYIVKGSQGEGLVGERTHFRYALPLERTHFRHLLPLFFCQKNSTKSVFQ